MRIFLDENVDPRLATKLIGHVIESIRSKGWFGVSNGELLSRIEGDFDILISHDQGLEYQQNWHARALGLVVLITDSTDISTYEAKLDELTEAIETFTTGVIRIRL